MVAVVQILFLVVLRLLEVVAGAPQRWEAPAAVLVVEAKQVSPVLPETPTRVPVAVTAVKVPVAAGEQAKQGVAAAADPAAQAEMVFLRLSQELL
jgi:hypothetical protein